MAVKTQLQSFMQKAAYGLANGAAQAQDFMAPAEGPLGSAIGTYMHQQLNPNLPTPASDSQDVRNGFVNQIANASPDMYEQGIPLHAQQPSLLSRIKKIIPGQQAQAQTPVTPTPTPQILGSETKKNVTSLEQLTRDTFKQYGVHPAVAYGIANAEGGKIGQNNLWNINAVDSNPQLATNYPDPLSAATSAAKLMNTMIQKKGAMNKTPEDQLSAIEQSGYAGDPTTWKQRSARTGGAGKTFNSWSDFVKATPAWKKWTSPGK